MTLAFQRNMPARDFATELGKLLAFRTGNMGFDLLEQLEKSGLLRPRVRIRYPDAVARRFWRDAHEDGNCQLELPIEPDGSRWNAAVEFAEALYRWRRFHAYGLSPNPLDEPAPRFTQFIEDPRERPFEAWSERRVDIRSDKLGALHSSENIEDCYSTWQLLLAAEVADAGIHIRINFADSDIANRALLALQNGRLPERAGVLVNIEPARSVRAFAQHERALDCVIWFAEESARSLVHIVRTHSGTRFQMSEKEAASYKQSRHEQAGNATHRFDIGVTELAALLTFLAEHWADWNRAGRPKIADAYKDVLGEAVALTREIAGISFAELRDLVGLVGGHRRPILDAIWPNWVEEEKERTRDALKESTALRHAGAQIVADADIDAFVDFLAAEGLEAFFWRLKSFETHAFHGNEFALEGMRSDIQGMAIAVEHVAAALSGSKTQLFGKFKQLWRDGDVLRILKRGDVAPLAQQARLAENWKALKAKIDALRSEPGGVIAADLVMAHRIRGGVHNTLPENDRFELERLFIGLMRAALHTFIEVRRCSPLT